MRDNSGMTTSARARVRLLVAPVLAGLLILSGCGSSNDTPSSSTSSTAASSAASSASTSIPLAGGGAPQPVTEAAADGKTMTLGTGAFDPGTVTIAVGSTVTITNAGTATADVIVGTEAPFELAAGASKILKFPGAGTFDVGAIKGTARGSITVG
jgi:plastocyanin